VPFDACYRIDCDALHENSNVKMQRLKAH
jgi:hypothetical protein